MRREHIVAISSHMVNHGISIDSDSVLPTCVNHLSQRIGVAHS